MTLQLVLELLALLVLIFIAAELYIIARELARTRIVLLKEHKSHESAQTTPSGQTINVNLGTVPAGNSSVTIPGTTTTPSVSTDPAPNATETDSSLQTRKEKKLPEPESTELHPKAVAVSLFAVKCPRCQAENSSYRSECYNCGEKL